MFRNKAVWTLFLSMGLFACGGGSGGSMATNGENPSRQQTGSTEIVTISGNISGNTDNVTLSLNGESQNFAGADFSFTKPVLAGSVYRVVVVAEPAGQICSVNNGVGTAAENGPSVDVVCTNSLSTGSARGLCAPHVTTDNSVIGNNTYEFRAGEGECFGQIEDRVMTKWEVPVSLAAQNNVFDISLVEVVGNGRLTRDGLYLYFVVDIKNTKDVNVCLRGRGEASILDAGDEELGRLGSIDLLGDVLSTGSSRYLSPLENNCIPPGATRTLWHSGAGRLSSSKDSFVSRLLLSLDVTAVDPSPDRYFLEPLTPQEAIWTNGTAVSDSFRYALALKFLNMTNSSVYVPKRAVAALYFDDNDFLVYDQLSSVDEFLGLDEKDLTDEDYLLPAMGGELGVLHVYGPPAMIKARASKVVVNLRICDDARSSYDCREQH